MTNKIKGIIPVMLTAFDDYGGIDWESQERLTEWYLERGSELCSLSASHRKCSTWI